ECDQVVQYAIADGFAEGVGGDLSDARVHATPPADFSECFRLSTKYCSRVLRTGETEISRSRSRRRASMAASRFSSASTARAVSPVTCASAHSAFKTDGTVPCHTSSTLP